MHIASDTADFSKLIQEHHHQEASAGPSGYKPEATGTTPHDPHSASSSRSSTPAGRFNMSDLVEYSTS